jgi:hypothetical protein
MVNNMPQTRQRKWQLNKTVVGCCPQCGKPRKNIKRSLCKPCQVKARERIMAVRGGPRWQPGKRGRPPISARIPLDVS